MKKFLVKLVQILFLPTLIFGGMYLAKLCEIVFSKVPDRILVPSLIILFLVEIYEILKRI